LIKVSKYLKQEESKVIALEPIKIIFNMEDYDVGDNFAISEDETKLWVKGLVCMCEVEGGEQFSMLLDYPVDFQISEINQSADKLTTTLSYEKDDLVFIVPLEKNEIKELVMYAKRLLCGKEIYKDVEHLLLKIYRVYGPISDMDLVHFEVLLSQCLRDKNYPMIPARAGRTPEEFSMYNIKKNVFSSSFLQGLAFENVGEAIKNGLTVQHQLEESVLEKILLGTLVPEEKE
jgi:hypothetical protein